MTKMCPKCSKTHLRVFLIQKFSGGNTPGLPLKWGGDGEGKGEEGRGGKAREEKGREGGKGLGRGICAVVNFP